MRRNQGCNPLEHGMARRQFLTGTMAGAAGTGILGTYAQADQLKHQEKRILQVFLQGGVSQLESWDPKPGTVHGGYVSGVVAAKIGADSGASAACRNYWSKNKRTWARL